MSGPGRSDAQQGVLPALCAIRLVAPESSPKRRLIITIIARIERQGQTIQAKFDSEELSGATAEGPNSERTRFKSTLA